MIYLFIYLIQFYFIKFILILILSEPGRQVDSISVNSEDGLLYWLDAKASLIIAAKTSCSQDHCLRTSLVNEHIDPYSRFLV